jgi:hypothetical protein
VGLEGEGADLARYKSARGIGPSKGCSRSLFWRPFRFWGPGMHSAHSLAAPVKIGVVQVDKPLPATPNFLSKKKL